MQDPIERTSACADASLSWLPSIHEDQGACDIAQTLCDLEACYRPNYTPATNIGAMRRYFTARGVTPGPLGVGNAKVGGPSTYRPTSSTCPTQCPYWEGCYAFSSYTEIASRRATDDTQACLAAVMCAAVIGKSDRKLVRLHTTGDFLRDGVLDAPYIEGLQAIGDWMLVQGHVNNDRRWAWTYTHAHTNPDIGLSGAKALRASLGLFGVEVLLSDVAVAGGAVAWPHSDIRELQALLPDGLRAVACPSQTHDDVTCHSCKYLCAKAGRLGDVIVFDPHGSSAKNVRAKCRDALYIPDAPNNTNAV